MTLGIIGMIQCILFISKKKRKKQLDHIVQCKKVVAEQLCYFPIGLDVETSQGPGTITKYNRKEDQYTLSMKDNSTHTNELSSNEIQIPKVIQLYVYPIKSCAGIPVNTSQLSSRGFQFDRLWMIVSLEGRFLTQRRFPKMCRIFPRLPTKDNDSLWISADGMEDIQVPIKCSKSKMLKVVVWKQTCDAIDQGDLVANWLERFLGIPCRLVRFPDHFVRPTSSKYAKGYQTGFADGFPLLVATEASLKAVNAKLEDHSIDIIRFRPNIVVSGVPLNADDRWEYIQIGNVYCWNVKPCSRCSMPNVNPLTGIREGNRISQILELFRTGKQLGLPPSEHKTVFFGNNYVADHQGEIQIGDPIRILSMKNIISI